MNFFGSPRGLAWLDQWSMLKPMRDGIYKVDFKAGQPDGYGIAMVRNAVFRGLDQIHVYLGKFQDQYGRFGGRLKAFPHPWPSRREVASMGQHTLKVYCTEVEDGFVLHGESEMESRVRYELRATWIAELQTPEL